jgi:hypothetical protein
MEEKIHCLDESAGEHQPTGWKWRDASISRSYQEPS